ncbi:MAG TPA: S8 family serine peptidase [Methanoregulaceae archaeon]|nr:S8 family serine peptidase [Methanoregulaceae archaeon]
MQFVPPAAALSGAQGKVSTDLLALVDDRFLLPNQSRGNVVAALARSGHYAKAGQRYRAVDTPSVDLVEVYVRTDPGTGAAALRPFVDRVSDEDASAGLVAAWVAPGRILDLARIPSVREVRQVLQPRFRTGSVTSAGDVLLRAADLRNATGLSGAGIKVGVISDGVDHRSSAQATGDLPPDYAGLTVLSNDVGGDEGTAMLEIVHDIAPNASLVFHDCGWNVLEFNRAIDALADAGCRVIVDDIGWIDEPFFEDGVVAAHAAEVVNSRGVVYVSAAGNDAGLHYQGLFLDDGQGWHDFSSGTNPARKRLYVDLPPGDSVTAVLQWSEPFGQAASNYDLALYNTADRSVPLAAGSRVQNGDDDPIEVLSWVNAGTSAVQAEVDVSKPPAAQARTLELFVYPRGGASLLPENTVPADSVYGHPAANGVVAVAAIDATDSTGGRIEPYSSRGPVTMIAPLATTRQKPDCSGVDGVRVTGAGSFPTGFWGTSAAAPHAAALAALIWSGRQDASGAQVRSALLATADDLGAAGADTVFGAGRLNATGMYALFSPAARQPAPLPGRIEAEDYDTGGEGVAYHDNETENLGGVYRPAEGVDIEPLLGSQGYGVGWIRPDEWLRYTVDVSATGAYALRVRGASSWGRPSLSLFIDGVPAATVPIAGKGSYDIFDLTNATVNLTAGEHQLRLALSGYFNLDYIEFEAPHAILRVPGAAADPRDLDGDGRYEDVNGNGRRDFADVVIYFNQMTWIAANEQVGGFDYNANERCDFADVTTLFTAL